MLPILSQSINDPEKFKKKESKNDLFDDFEDETHHHNHEGLLSLEHDNSIVNSQVIIKHSKKMDEIAPFSQDRESNRLPLNNSSSVGNKFDRCTKTGRFQGSSNQIQNLVESNPENLHSYIMSMDTNRERDISISKVIH